MIFLIDLPRLPEGRRTKPEEITFFGKELIYFLEAMGLEQSIIDSMYNFDYTATKDLAFVHNIGGAHSGESWKRTGYCGLGRAVKRLGLATDKHLHIDFVTSSVGSLNDDFLAMLYLAARGDDGLVEYNWRNLPSASKKKKAPQEILHTQDEFRQWLRSHLRQDFRVYYPTHETVKSSTARSAGTIWFQSKWYNSPTFPREILRDCKSVRPGMLMHNKVKLKKNFRPFRELADSISYSTYGPKTTHPSPGRTLGQPTVRRAHGASLPRIEQRKSRNSTVETGNVGWSCRCVGLCLVLERVTWNNLRGSFRFQCRFLERCTAIRSHGISRSSRRVVGGEFGNQADGKCVQFIGSELGCWIRCIIT